MRRSRRHAGNPFVEPDLPITPMLDMSFQLLAFFLMTFNPTPTEGHLDVMLPPVVGGKSSDKIPDPFTDAPEDVLVKVDADERGEIATVTVTQGKVEGGGVTIPGRGREARQGLFKELQRRLADLKKTPPAEGKPFAPPKVKLELADNLTYGLVIALMDECSRAGYPSVAPVLKDDKK